MPNQHKRPPLALRLPEGLEAWYRAEAARRKTALNALAVEALTAFRDGSPPQAHNQAGKAAAKPSEPHGRPGARPWSDGPQRPSGPRPLGYSKEQQTRGRR